MSSTTHGCGATGSASSPWARVETGVAIADFDRDGRPDIFAVSKNGPCALYHQVAPWKFRRRRPGRRRRLRRRGGEQDRRHRGRHQPGRLARPVCLPLRRPQSALREQPRWHLHRARRRVRPRPQRRLRTCGLRRLRSRRRPRLLRRHQHPRLQQVPQGRRDYLLRNDGDGSFRRRHGQGRHLGTDPGPHRASGSTSTTTAGRTSMSPTTSRLRTGST